MVTLEKIDLKRELGELYSAARSPTLVEVPKLPYLMVDGTGDPESAAFGQAVQGLYQVAYSLKFRLKQRGLDHTVMPLEGLWWGPEGQAWDSMPRSAWRWTLMIVQPPSVTASVVRETIHGLDPDKRSDRVPGVRLERFAEGTAVQILHVGPYATERETIEKVDAFIRDQGFVATGRHHEIYLGDPRRSAPERLKTIIRHPVKRAR